ncbi:hypothetical protein CFE70_002091 [Pyrenophora teres f. teres 0-1]
MLPGTNHSRAIARSGVDWICVDTEHGNINDSQMHEAVTAIAHAGVSPLVRIAANEAWMVKRALDAGAHGVVVPLIYTVDDAKRLVSSTKFPPQGTRGLDPELEEAIEKIKDAAHAEGKKVAMYCNSGEDAKRYADRGFDMISILTDQMGITGAFKQSLSIATGAVEGSGDTSVKGYDGK